MNKYEKIFTVKREHLANVVESGTSPVLSTPSLLCFIENTCMNSISNILNKDENNKKTCVGIKCELKHIKPSLIGDKIKCESELVFIEKRKLYFKINVYSWRPGNNTNSILIAECEHVRCLVPEDFYKWS